MKGFLVIGCFCFTLYTGFAQEYPIDQKLSGIEGALSEAAFQRALEMLEKEAQFLRKEKDWLNLTYLIPYAGRIADKLEGEKRGVGLVQEWVKEVLTVADDLRAHRQAHLESQTYFDHVGLYELAYKANEEALSITLLITDHRPAQWAVIESNLGVIANKMGNPELAKKHTLKALEGYEQDPDTTEENRFNLLNDMGVRYYYAAQFDSAGYYWHKCLDFIEEMEPNLVNTHYRKAMIQSNLGAIYDIKGQTQESIRLLKSSISNALHFIENALDDPKRERAFLSFFYGSINLAATYKSIGNFAQALHIHEYTLKEKEKHYPSDHPEIIESWVLIGQAHYSMHNLEEAKRWLKQGLRALRKLDGDYYLQEGDANHTLARIYASENKVEEAKNHYKEAEIMYKSAFEGSYDYVFLDFLATASEFYAKQKDRELALALANEGYVYISGIEGLYSIPGFRQEINLGQVAFYLEDYEQAKIHAIRGQDILKELIKNAQSELDSIRITFDQPEAVLLEVKATYASTPNRDIEMLRQLHTQLKEALKTADKRKQIITEDEDMRVLMAHNQELVDLIKKIQYELYKETGEALYLESLLATHESGVYYKIRAQMNRSAETGFVDIPNQILKEENELKTRVRELLESGSSLTAYHSAMSDWEAFLEKLKEYFPKYYQTRYSLVWEEGLVLSGDIQWVRYMFLEDNLVAVVNTREGLQLFPLEFDSALLEGINQSWNEPTQFGQLCFGLYQQLWAPFSQILDEGRVFIIPDGQLHNLSFDLLLERPIDSFREIAQASLLAKHDLSTHFSLHRMPSGQHEVNYSNYIAFAPGFMDSMKDIYVENLNDSLSLDNAYLSLLPQPFTLSLAEKTSKLLNGRSFTHGLSTIQSFKEHAANHKIIHIGTHAESNNLSPAFSRLIFSKTSDEDHSLYAYEIYDVDLSANLAILAACETGKPVYQPGEGMISLAHAFQYAGSESLLTSLWKIDEKSSMEITSYFFEFILEGFPKDKALKEAKLKYLNENHGRVLSPQYWAGLILIGNPDPISIDRNKPYWWWITMTGAGLIVGLLLFSKKVKPTLRRS
ncbi:CHAT domain-containing protein [Pleomorphovibrio marinus]|uniref:CHAT domain-containing protein n=1 Tax=Pleomorphovibrio marinus TaxID=2164132 RepID=UPI000E0B2343|nr:CHAT domain-containing protein [Pleomorphovibrio marinus]